jgi:hypothetical protein
MISLESDLICCLAEIRWHLPDDDWQSRAASARDYDLLTPPRKPIDASQEQVRLGRLARKRAESGSTDKKMRAFLSVVNWISGSRLDHLIFRATRSLRSCCRPNL